MKLLTVNSVAARYSTSIGRDVLYPALHELISLDSLLISNIFNAQGVKPVLKKLDSIDLDKIVFFRPAESYDTEFVNNLYDNTEPLQYEQAGLPLWRIYVLGESQQDVVWIFDHSIFDAASGIYFHQKLLKSLRKGLDPVSSSVVKSSPIELTSSIEALADVSPGIGKVFKTMFNTTNATVNPKKPPHPKQISHENTRAEVENRTFPWAEPEVLCPASSKTLLFQLSPDKLEQLHELSHNLGVSITSVIYAALLQAILELVPNNNNNYQLDTNVPFNARPYFKKPSRARDLLGNHIFQYTFPMTISSTCRERVPYKFIASWAKYFEQDISRYRDHHPNPLGHKIGEIKYMNLKKQFESMIAGPRQSAAEIANLGNVTFSEDNGSPTITELSYVQPVSTIGSGITLNLVSVKNGPTSFSLSIAGDDNSYTKCTQIRDSFLATLQNGIDNKDNAPKDDAETATTTTGGTNTMTTTTTSGDDNDDESAADSEQK